MLEKTTLDLIALPQKDEGRDIHVCSAYEDIALSGTLGGTPPKLNFKHALCNVSLDVFAKSDLIPMYICMRVNKYI